MGNTAELKNFVTPPEPDANWASLTLQPSFFLSDIAYVEIVELWILRVLVRMGAYKNMLLLTGVCGDPVFAAVGLDAILDMEREGEYEQKKSLKLLAERHAEVERKGVRVPLGRPLETNLAWLSDRLGLNDVEVAILRCVVLLNECAHLDAALDFIGNFSLRTITRTFAVVLNVPEDRIAKALAVDAALATSGLITLDKRYQETFQGRVQFLSRLSDQMFITHADPMHILHELVVPGQTAKLGANDYGHVADDLALLSRYLERSKGKKGVNFLIYGPPGTGKTEFVRMIAARLARPLFEVATQHNGRFPLAGDKRLLAFRFAQQMLHQDHETLILFDEIEDVFCNANDDASNVSAAKGMKAWMNQLLESNAVPTFWLSNSIDAIDDALTRRFDYVLRLDSPPRRVRASIVSHYFENIPVSERWIKHVSEHDELAPAVVERAAKVAASLDGMPAADIERVAARIISGTLEAMSLPPIPKFSGEAATEYRLECINTDPPIDTLPERLATSGRGRLCLYGPPGTGKTALGRYLADAIGQRLIVKRASDLLSPYVGVAEKKMARMFAEASEERAVLLLDEADSFLQDRSRASRSWEISQVNEMLCQMEQFEGIFIASTNFMTSLDSATLRRFDLKIRFDWLKPDQAEQLFGDALLQLGLPAAPSVTAQVRALDRLTPGDFANVLRQSALRVIDSATTLYHCLQSEVAAKPGASQLGRIGF